jgi:hypothetical protein
MQAETDASLHGAGIYANSLLLSGAKPEHEPGFARIVERVFDLPDPDAEYQHLEQALTVGSQEFDSLFAALDSAESNARRAHRLYVNARLEHDRYTHDCEVVTAALWSAAQASLQADKDAGLRTKQITDSDTRHKASELYPDEYRDISTRTAKADGMLKHLERLADLWQSRCRSLSALLATKR